MFNVLIKKKIEKQLKKLLLNVKQLFMLLVCDIEKTGAIQYKWKNYSKIGNNEHHCHLTYNYVACWREINDKISIEVYYVGSREKAPY
jgi:hypothetical protein